MANSLEILPKTVREILNINNDEIINLCKVGNLPLRLNAKGLTYFTTEDVKTLKKLQDINKKALETEEKVVQLKSELKKLPAKKSEIVPAADNSENKNYKLEKMLLASKKEAIELLTQLTATVKNIESGIFDKFALTLDEKLENKLEEKLGGIDSVIMDLVQSKTEADEIRRQLAEKEKEVYELKNELSSFQKVAGNIYLKKTVKKAFDL